MRRALGGALLGVLATACGGGDSVAPNTPAAIEFVTLSGTAFEPPANFEPGASLTLQARVVNRRGTPIAGAVATLSVDDTTAAVLRDNVLTARQPGTVVVVARHAGLEARLTVAVSGAPVARIAIDADVAVYLGGTRGVPVQLLSASGSELLHRRLSAVSSDPARVRVTPAALGNGRWILQLSAPAGAEVGTVSVTLRSEGAAAVVAATIGYPPVATLQLQSIGSFLYVGDSVQLAAFIRDIFNQPRALSTLALNSRDPAVATVSPTGMIKAIAEGATWVVASAESVADSVSVRVISTAHLGFRTIEVTGISARARSAVDWALQRWRQVIVRGGPPTPVSLAPGQCSLPDGLSEVVVDIVIVVRELPLEPPTAGQGGPCVARGAAPFTAVVGRITLSQSFVASPNVSDQTLRNLALHEIGHALGSGTTSNLAQLGLSSGIPGSDPVFIGGNAVREFLANPGGAAYPGRPVPLANVEGPGSIYSHWRTAHFPNELMRVSLVAGPMPLSAITAGQLNDLGYEVRYDLADPVTINPGIPGAFAQVVPAPRAIVGWSLDGDAEPPEFVVDRLGRMIRLRPPAVGR